MAKRTIESLEREITDHSRYFETLMVKQARLQNEQKEIRKAFYEILILVGLLGVRFFIETYIL